MAIQKILNIYCFRNKAVWLLRTSLVAARDAINKYVCSTTVGGYCGTPSGFVDEVVFYKV
jgi:hypothetical protein